MKDIIITIQYNNPGPEDAKDIILKSAQATIERLFLDLELPFKSKIVLNSNIPVSNYCGILIDGNLHSGFYVGGNNQEKNSIENTITSQFLYDLEIYITTDLVDYYWQKIHCHKTTCPQAVFRLYKKLVEYRIKPSRLPQIKEDFTEEDLNTAFEHALSETPRFIEMQVHPERFETISYQIENYKDNVVNGSGTMISMMVDGLFYELGIIIGNCRLTSSDELKTDQFRLRINDIHTHTVNIINDNEHLVNDTVDHLTLLNIKGVKAVNPANGSECAIIPSEYTEIAEKAGLTTWDAAGYAILFTSSMTRKAAKMLLSLEAVEVSLDKLEQAFPALTKRIKETIGIPKLTRLLRLLIAEEISIRDLRSILESLLVVPPPSKINLGRYITFSAMNGIRPCIPKILPENIINDIEVVEYLRMRLKRYISHKYTRGSNTLVVYLLEPGIEERLRQEIPLTYDERIILINGIDKEVRNLPSTAQNPVILTTAEVRWRLRNEIRLYYPHLAVLSYQELNPDLNIQTIARIESDLSFIKRSDIWDNTYKKNIAKSFQNLLSQFSEPLSSSSRNTKSKYQKDKNNNQELINSLYSKKLEIVEKVFNKIKVNNQLETLHTELKNLLEWYVDGYLENLSTQKSDILDDLYSKISKVQKKYWIKFSDIYQIPLLIAETIRNILTTIFSGSDKGKIDELLNCLEQLDTTKHHAAMKAIQSSFKTTFK